MKEFYFFRGFVVSRRTALWFPENDTLDYYRNNYINAMSENIAQQIDQDLVNYMTREMNLQERVESFERRISYWEGGNRA